jgi:hypothetical protein
MISAEALAAADALAVAGIAGCLLSLTIDRMVAGALGVAGLNSSRD